MGGSGGGRGAPIGDLTELKKLADSELQRAEGAKRNVFISFALEDKNEVDLLRGQSANEKSDIEFSDWSVKTPFDSDNADYIRSRIEERIEHSSVTVVYLSKDAGRSKWVKWEVEKSLELGKQVLAVHKGNRPPSSLPDVVKKRGIKVVKWSKMAEEIEKLR